MEPQVPFNDDIDVRIATIGNVDAGKSTIVGVLTQDKLDDGRGSVRQTVFNFKQELDSGRTSSIGQQIMGFDKDNKQVVLKHARKDKNENWGNIVMNSQKIVTFIDLCGHEKYLKTTMFGLQGLLPDYSMILIGANMGLSKMTKEHIGICLATGIPFFVIFTKIDIAPEQVFEKNVNLLTRILSSAAAAKKPFLIKNDDENLDLAKHAQEM